MIKLDGAALAVTLLTSIQNASANLIPTPKLAIVSVGNDPASALYVKKKSQIARKAGFLCTHLALASDCTEQQLHKALKTYSEDSTIHGILLQLPLPQHLSADKAILWINPDKDVDGLHPLNMGRLQMGAPLVIPCTPKGILSLLAHYNIPIKKQNVVILGRSHIVGLPLFLAMTQRGATVTLCHRDSPDITTVIEAANIVVSATGQIDVFPAHFLRKNSVLIDVGIIRTPEGLRGDIALSDIPTHIKAYTPVPFGIGPMTVISLMENLLILYQKIEKSND